MEVLHVRVIEPAVDILVAEARPELPTKPVAVPHAVAPANQPMGDEPSVADWFMPVSSVRRIRRMWRSSSLLRFAVFAALLGGVYLYAKGTPDTFFPNEAEIVDAAVPPVVEQDPVPVAEVDVNAGNVSSELDTRDTTELLVSTELLSSVDEMLASEGRMGRASTNLTLQSLKSLQIVYPGDPQILDRMERLTERLANEATLSFSEGDILLAGRLIELAVSTGVAQHNVDAALGEIEQLRRDASARATAALIASTTQNAAQVRRANSEAVQETTSEITPEITKTATPATQSPISNSDERRSRSNNDGIVAGATQPRTTTSPSSQLGNTPAPNAVGTDVAAAQSAQPAELDEAIPAGISDSDGAQEANNREEQPALPILASLGQPVSVGLNTEGQGGYVSAPDLISPDVGTLNNPLSTLGGPLEAADEAPPPAAPSEREASQPIESGLPRYAISALTPIRQELIYPSDAPAGARGAVAVEFTVTPSGRVRDVRLLDDEAPVYFMEAAIRTVARWRFEPVEQNGANIPVRTAVRLRFVE